MRRKTFLTLWLMILMTGTAVIALTVSAAANKRNEFWDAKVLLPQDDPISGEWDVTFRVRGTTTPATFKLKLEGEKVTGTAESAHTGAGIVRDGSWKENKLSFTLDFAKHESIAISGALIDRKLTGEFRTEGFVAKWEGTKRETSSRSAMSATNANSSDPIAGEWTALFEANGSSVPITFRFVIDGQRLTGTSESAHLGSSTLTEGKWLDGSLSFNMKGPHGSIAVKGNLKEGKLSGDFDAGQFKGTWRAERK